jgi:cation:H+ antiporter
VNPFLAMALGIVCSGIGGDLFVRGIVGLSRWMRVSAGIIGATVAAFGTSAPELSVGIMAGLAGTPQVSLGDVLGSNIINVALVLGITLVIGGLHSSRAKVKRDFVFALCAPVVLALLSLDGVLSGVDGYILWILFMAWMVATVLDVRKQRSATGKVLGKRHGGLSLAFSGLGLALLIAAGRLIILGAKGIAAALGVGGFIVGALIVAVGTSVPELATAVISKVKGYEEVGLSTVLGSNIFNGLFIIPTVVVIHPIPVPWPGAALAIGFGMAAVAMILPTNKGMIDRWRGAVLLALYLLYLALSLL